jgi:hypothetical protein
MRCPGAVVIPLTPMSADKKPANLLDSLRARSDAMRGQEKNAKRTPDDVLKELDRKMWHTFKWLDEAIGHLAVIKPAVAHEYRVAELLTIASPQFEQGFVSYRRKAFAGYEAVEYIEVFYRLSLPKPIDLVVPVSAVSGVDDRLRQAQLKFQYRPVQDDDRVVRRGAFNIVAAVTGFAKFLPDYRRQTVEVTLRNVDRFETVIVEFNADKFDDSTLEDLVRFILGEDNAFLRHAPLVGIGARKPQLLPNEEATSYRV